MSDNLRTFVVLYTPVDDPLVTPPLGFRCEAEDVDHAEEQMENAEPGATIVWVAETDSLDEALTDYWS